MRKVLIAASALMLCAAPAFAADDAMAGYFGNTTVSTGRGFETRTHYKPDHTLDVVFTGMGGSLTSKGTWSIDKGQLCRVYDTPPPGITNPVCIPAEAHRVGDHWTVTVNGATRDATMTAGVN